MSLYRSSSYTPGAPTVRPGASLRRSSSRHRSPAPGATGSTYSAAGYGYGGGVARSASAAVGFGRYGSTILTPPTWQVYSGATSRSVPSYSDRFPYVRYTGTSASVAYTPRLSAIQESTRESSYGSYGGRYLGTAMGRTYTRSGHTGAGSFYTQRYLDALSSSQHKAPAPSMPRREWRVDDAVSHFKHGSMTAGTLSKYALTPSYSEMRRKHELHTPAASAYTSTYGSGTYGSAQAYGGRYTARYGAPSRSFYYAR